MNKFRITVQQIEGEDMQEFNERFARDNPEGIECEGMVILAKQNEENARSFIRNLTQMDIADMIANSSKITAAAILAKAMKEANQVMHQDEISSKLASIFGN